MTHHGRTGSQWSESDAGGGEGKPWGLDGALSDSVRWGWEEGGGFLERRVIKGEWRKSTEIETVQSGGWLAQRRRAKRWLDYTNDASVESDTGSIALKTAFIKMKLKFKKWGSLSSSGLQEETPLQLIEVQRCERRSWITGSEFRNHQMITRPWLRPPINSRREESPIPAGVPGSAGQSLSPERRHMVHRRENSYLDVFDIYELYYFYPD